MAPTPHIDSVRRQTTLDGPGRQREALGEVVATCELRQSAAATSARPHFYRSVLRDLLGNAWQCDHRHLRREEAQACAELEYEAQIAAGVIKPGRRRGR